MPENGRDLPRFVGFLGFVVVYHWADSMVKLESSNHPSEPSAIPGMFPPVSLPEGTIEFKPRAFVVISVIGQENQPF